MSWTTQDEAQLKKLQERKINYESMAPVHNIIRALNAAMLEEGSMIEKCYWIAEFPYVPSTMQRITFDISITGHTATKFLRDVR